MPAPSNWLVSSGVQLAGARLVVPSKIKNALATPPVPLRPRLFPEIEIAPKAGEGTTVLTTAMTPFVASALVFHARFAPSGGN